MASTTGAERITRKQTDEVIQRIHAIEERHNLQKLQVVAGLNQFKEDGYVPIKTYDFLWQASRSGTMNPVNYRACRRFCNEVEADPGVAIDLAGRDIAPLPRAGRGQPGRTLTGQLGLGNGNPVEQAIESGLGAEGDYATAAALLVSHLPLKDKFQLASRLLAEVERELF